MERERKNEAKKQQINKDIRENAIIYLQNL